MDFRVCPLVLVLAVTHSHPPWQLRTRTSVSYLLPLHLLFTVSTSRIYHGARVTSKSNQTQRSLSQALWCLLIVLWTLTPVLQSANKDHVVSPQPHLSLIPALRFAPGGCPPKKVCLWESLFVSRYVVNSTGSGSSEHVQMQSTPASSRTSHQGEVSYSRPSPARHPPLSAAGLPTGG